MVVELAKGNDVGKYTGYYYTASMAAQIITPVLSGGIMDLVGNMSPLFPYATIFVTLAFITMLFVKHGDSKPISKGFLESIGEDN
jgi:MFS family permease